ncbi:hypothetical protein CAPTEDRAFT_222852 [Capitella teleta]|uniref:PDZ domain-containing protein n=1 Tax=Capitella teleta TaxID=283909 RepID=R7U548_CAPTE|nr:hypothetical protein CAPTEDRAFT_222852 [Capitella teleta]|eukprot:ELU01475.1 hypothetical protein CAPTEDRAFT_222852 [Capitella teleta]
MNSYGGQFGQPQQQAGGQAGAIVSVQIQRMDPNQPWGFRLSGGTDFRQELQIKKVDKTSPAQGQIHEGDAIMTIGGYDATQLTHMQAKQMIIQAGNVLQLTIKKVGSFLSFNSFPTPSYNKLSYRLTTILCRPWGSRSGYRSLKPKGQIKFSPGTAHSHGY